MLNERLPGILRAAAEVLETDAELSTPIWLPILRTAGIIFRSTETLASHAKESTLALGSQQLTCLNLFKVISLVCNIVSQESPTPLEIMRFRECLVEAANDLSHQLSTPGATEDTEIAKANTLKLWLDTARYEIQAARSLIPEDTPVFTCPFPLCRLHVSNHRHAAMDSSRGTMLGATLCVVAIEATSKRSICWN